MYLSMMAVTLVLLTAAYWMLVAQGRSLNMFLVLLSLGCLIAGFLTACINIPVSTSIMRSVDRDKLSKVMSILNILSMGLIPIASVIAGAVLQYAGSTPLLLVCSLGFTATAVFMLFNKSAHEI